ncbi:MAG: hypothetical protein R3B55_02870 [Candidatus Paceibacterota bacterium]
MIKKAVNYITTDMAGLRATKDNFKIPEISEFVGLIKMVSENKINSRGAKDILAILMAACLRRQETQKKLQKKKVFFKNQTLKR